MPNLWSSLWVLTVLLSLQNQQNQELTNGKSRGKPKIINALQWKPAIFDLDGLGSLAMALWRPRRLWDSAWAQQWTQPANPTFQNLLKDFLYYAAMKSFSCSLRVCLVFSSTCNYPFSKLFLSLGILPKYIGNLLHESQFYVYCSVYCLIMSKPIHVQTQKRNGFGSI